MNKRYAYRLALYILAFAVTLSSSAALAHDGPPQIMLATQRLAPGMVLEVYGTSLGDEDITVTLIGKNVEFPLGIVHGDDHGDFVQAFTLPQTMPQGNYTVLVTSMSQITLSAPLEVAGLPIAAKGEGEQRDASEPLLAPVQPETPPIAPQPPVISPPASSTREPAMPVMALLALSLLGFAIWQILVRRLR